MWKGDRRQRILGLLAVGLLAAGAGLAAHAAGLLGWLERGTVDARFSDRGAERPPANLLVVGIDNNSLAELPRYPFPRRLHDRVMENLHAAGARLIVYDIAFDRPSTPAENEALFQAATRAAPVVFATSLITTSGNTGVLGGNANLASIGDQAAAADLVPDSDGVLRHMLGEVSGLPSIAAAVSQRLNGHGANPKVLSGGWIDYRGPPGRVRNLSFLRVLRNTFDAAAVRGKVVVVGATAPGLQDVHSTPVGSPMSGPEVQANAISTALGGATLLSPPGAITVLLISLLAALVPLAGLHRETLGAAAVGFAALILWTVATQLAFDSGTVLDYSDPFAALLMGTSGTVLLGIWSDRRERNHLRMLFAADQSGVVDQVLHAPGDRPIEPTAIIAGYKLEQVVGRGGMGIVYCATQLALQRTVAVKLIAADRAEDPEFRERFKSESRIAASIEHANVIPVYEAGEDDGLLFIAMRLVDGIDLAQVVKRSGPLEPTRAARIITQLAGALDAAHARGLVHRDVKPANVLLTLDEPEHAYLTDFGLAKQVSAVAQMTRVGQLVGTLDYLAPEQIRGEQVDASADIYALTGLLYRCLTGQAPFPRESEAATLWAHVSAPPPAPSQVRRGLPSALDAVIARGMAKEPGERFASAGALARACARALGIREAPAASGLASPAGPPSSGSAPTLLSE